MFSKERITSLCVVVLMLMAAAITVNKTVFDIDLQETTSAEKNAAVGNATNVGKSASPEESELNVGGEVDAAGKGMTIHTSGLAGTVDGYAGPVPLDIVIVDGKINEIKALPNSETPSFFKRAASLLSEWEGKTPEEAEEMKVDAVSGATYSSEAIINNVRVGLAQYEGVRANKESTTPAKIWIAFAVTFAACIVPLFVRNKLYHYVQMGANVIVLGFWCGQFLDYYLILKYVSNGVSLPAGLTAIAMLTAAFIYPLFGRPQHYCNHICPLGAAQQIVAGLCGYKIRISKKILHLLDWIRKLLWAVLMLLLWADCLTGWMDLELFQAFQFESASIGIIIAAICFVLLSAVITRPYCRFVCPTGSLFKRAENIG